MDAQVQSSGVGRAVEGVILLDGSSLITNSSSLLLGSA